MSLSHLLIYSRPYLWTIFILVHKYGHVKHKITFFSFLCTNVLFSLYFSRKISFTESMGRMKTEPGRIDILAAKRLSEFNQQHRQLTVRALETLTGIKKSTVANLLSGARPITASQYVDLCSAIGVVDPGVLLDDIIAEVERAELADTLTLAAHEHEGALDGSTDEYGHPLDTIGEESQENPHAD